MDRIFQGKPINTRDYEPSNIKARDRRRPCFERTAALTTPLAALAKGYYWGSLLRTPDDPLAQLAYAYGPNSPKATFGPLGFGEALASRSPSIWSLGKLPKGYGVSHRASSKSARRGTPVILYLQESNQH